MNKGEADKLEKYLITKLGAEVMHLSFLKQELIHDPNPTHSYHKEHQNQTGKNERSTLDCFFFPTTLFYKQNKYK